MTADIERRLDAAGVTIEPLVWKHENRKSWSSGVYRIIDARNRENYLGFIWSQIGMGWNGRSNTLEAAADAHHRESAVAQFGVTQND